MGRWRDSFEHGNEVFGFHKSGEVLLLYTEQTFLQRRVLQQVRIRSCRRKKEMPAIICRALKFRLQAAYQSSLAD
jgi:hypothetical protein